MRRLDTTTLTLVALASAACAGRAAPIISPPAPSRLEVLPALAAAPPASAGFDSRLGASLDSVMAVALSEGAAPGATLAVGRHGRLVHLKAYGRLSRDSSSAPVNIHTMFDMASLTKVVATTTAAMILEEEGLLDIEQPVAKYLPEFDAPDKAGITVRHLLVHRGGLEAFAALYRDYRGRDQYLQQINARPVRSAPGTETVYSDWDMILLQLVIERITGQTLDQLLASRVFGPLGMTSTMFNPDSSIRGRTAPTEVDSFRGGLVWGAVHDENAWAMGGVSGHAGLFSTAPDAAIFAQMLLNGGEYNGVKILKPQTIARWTTRQGKESSRALGWDTPSDQSSSGRFFSARSFGHTGFTGTSMWVDPEKSLFVILLTNRVNATRQNNRHVPLRRDVADAVQQAITDALVINWESRR